MVRLELRFVQGRCNAGIVQAKLGQCSILQSLLQPVQAQEIDSACKLNLLTLQISFRDSTICSKAACSWFVQHLLSEYRTGEEGLNVQKVYTEVGSQMALKHHVAA